MKLCTYGKDGDRRVGFEVGGLICDLVDAADANGVELSEAKDLRLLAKVENLPLLGSLNAAVIGMSKADLEAAEWTHEAGAVTLHHPFRPRMNFISVYGNTADEHHAERIRKGKPWVSYSTKTPNTAFDPSLDINWRGSITSQVYAEPYLAVIVGSTTSYVAPDDALGNVFGYSVATNISSADLKRRHGQWDKANSLDSFLPWGPFVVTADEVGDPDALSCRLWLNDRMAISGAIGSGMLSTAQIVSEISFGIALEAGDVLLTSSAESVGHGQVPERWLQDGDTVRTAIDGIGELTNGVKTY